MCVIWLCQAIGGKNRRMREITNNELILKAKEIAKFHKVSDYVRIGEDGCALVTNKNNIFLSVSIDAGCGIGFCAEHNAIANMVTNGEYEI